MKSRIFVALTGWCVMLTATASGQTEVEAVKAAIVRETTSFFAVDKNAWEKNWLDAAYTYWTSSDSTGGSFVVGTDNIKRNFEEYFQTAKPSKSKMNREWLEIRLYGKGAYVRFIQRVNDGIDNDVTSEVRVLEKDKDGAWKIVFLNATPIYTRK